MAALLILASGVAAADPQSIALDAYKARLQEIATLLEGNQPQAAARLADSTWKVETPKGPVHADLRPLREAIGQVEAGRLPREEALRLVREHIQAADDTVGAPSVDTARARERLDRALQQAERESKAWDAIARWLMRLFGREDRAPGAATPRNDAAPFLTWGALVVGAAGVILLGLSLMRNLSGQAAGEETKLRKGRVREDRPPTPAELRQEAAAAAAAGNYREALRLAHLSLLQHYDEIGLVRYVPAQTNREHERQVRRKYPDLARTLRDLNDLVDVRLYAGFGASAEDYQRADRLIEQLWREGDAASKGAKAIPGAS